MSVIGDGILPGMNIGPSAGFFEMGGFSPAATVMPHGVCFANGGSGYGMGGGSGGGMQLIQMPTQSLVLRQALGLGQRLELRPRLGDRFYDAVDY